MASFKAEVADLVGRLVSEHGCKATLTKAGHWKVSRPGNQPVILSRTPSDQRAVRNMHGDIKRNLGITL